MRHLRNVMQSGIGYDATNSIGRVERIKDVDLVNVACAAINVLEHGSLDLDLGRTVLVTVVLPWSQLASRDATAAAIVHGRT